MSGNFNNYDSVKVNPYVKEHEDKGRVKVKELVSHLSAKSERQLTLTFTDGQYDINDGWINNNPFEVKYRYNCIDDYDSQYISTDKFENMRFIARSKGSNMCLYIVYLKDGNYLIYDLLKINVTHLPIRSGHWSKVTPKQIDNYELPNKWAYNIKID